MHKCTYSSLINVCGWEKRLTEREGNKIQPELNFYLSSLKVPESGIYKYNYWNKKLLKEFRSIII